MSVTHFDWDSEKDAENQRKHGVSFAQPDHRSRVLAEGEVDL